MRDALGFLAYTRSEWAGIPMPIEGERLVVEPRYPNAEFLMSLGGEDPPEDRVVRNTFWSRKYRSEVFVWERDGRIGWGVVPGVNHFEFDLHTLGCSFAWGLEQEENALATLADLTSEHQMKCYLLTGMFLETSKRSRITYVFRRLRPTVAVSFATGESRILAGLCLHPIGFYRGSYAGAMTPTDDVVAHLMLMRGDEHHFWKKANQHQAYRPEAGL
jgi:hypothetical protein